MPDKKTIAIDIDDVLADSTDALRLVVNKRLNLDLSPEDYRIEADYPKYYESVWQQNGIGGKITYAELESGMIQDQSHIVPHRDARLALRELAKRYRLIVMTSRPASWRKATERWLRRYFPDTFEEILFTEETDGKSKGWLCNKCGADWLIDDNVEHAQSAIDAGVEVILFGDYGWHHKVPPHMHRRRSWKQVLEYFDGRS